jgi:hypothetical protein
MASMTDERVDTKLRSLRRQVAMTVLSGFVACLVAIGVGVAYVKYDGARRDRDWCGMLNLIVQPDAPAPDNQRGRDIVAEAQRMRAERDC